MQELWVLECLGVDYWIKAASEIVKEEVAEMGDVEDI